MTAREKFRLGQRIYLSPRYSGKTKSKMAVVVGWSKSPLAVRVLIDGLKEPQTWSLDYWRVKP